MRKFSTDNSSTTSAKSPFKTKFSSKHYRRLVRQRVQAKFDLYDSLCDKDTPFVVQGKKVKEHPTLRKEIKTNLTATMKTTEDSKLSSNSSQSISSNNSSIHLINVNASLSLNQSHFMYESSGPSSDIDTNHSQNRPLSISSCKDNAECNNAIIDLDCTATKAAMERLPFESSSLEGDESKAQQKKYNNTNNTINIKQFFEKNVEKRLQLIINNTNNKNSHGNLNVFVEKYCNYDSNKFDTSVNILIERLKALALYFSTVPSSQYITWRICSALRNIIQLSKAEMAKKADSQYYWNHPSLNFCRPYLKIEKNNGFVVSPWMLEKDYEEDSLEETQE
jgi:hypothetical protein